MQRFSLAKHAANFLVLVAILAVSEARLQAGANQFTSQGVVLKWNPGVLIPFVINPGGVPGFTGELEKPVITGAVRDAFRAWTTIPGATITFDDMGLSPNVDRATDGVNLISFQPTSFNFPPGVLAVTSVVATSVTGQIVDADIIFNPQPPSGPFSPVGATNSTDLVAVAVHEIGHLLGLGHSGVSSSIMNPALVASAGVANRNIAADDAITVAMLYPAASFVASTGTISGTITTSTGAPVKAAHVIAVSNPGGVPVASQLSGPSGLYSIQGLPPGNYRVLVEPLNGPIGISDMSSFYADGQSDFETTFLGGLGSPTNVAVGAGQTASANIQLPPNPASLLNLEFVGTVTGSTGFLATRPLFLPRGLQYQVVALEATRATDTNFGFSSPDITLVGSTVGGTLGGTPARSQNVSISSAATLGPSNLTLANNDGATVMPGGVIVTVNPTIVAPLREIAGFGTTLGPGALLNISGTDLAERLAFAPSFPLPTNLGGVSVKIGDRFAPLFFVSPKQIIAMVPYEVSGQVNVQVVTGPRAGGNSVAVNLSPTAPGIFSTNLSGSGQGAILNADNSLAAPGGAGRPAKRGDVVTIYASGLGPVTPTLPSGLEAGSGGTTIPTLVNQPTVRIGGQVATVNSTSLAAGYAGFYVITAQVPANASTGNNVPVQITTFEGQASNTVTMAIGP